MEVQPCDFIAEVNGESSLEAMTSELQRRSAVRLRVLRWKPVFQANLPGIDRGPGRVVGLKCPQRCSSCSCM